mmetsp:Transcript_40841/g.94023  ORF Transcript_40841/g.94023 Transcript_40841/m.94023 type:complete len:238 (+) Transcript_40841:1-714(+)
MKRTYIHLKDEGLDWASGARRCPAGEGTRIRREPTLQERCSEGTGTREEGHSGFSALFSSPTTDHHWCASPAAPSAPAPFYSQRSAPVAAVHCGWSPCGSLVFKRERDSCAKYVAQRPWGSSCVRTDVGAFELCTTAAARTLTASRSERRHANFTPAGTTTRGGTRETCRTAAHARGRAGTRRAGRPLRTATQRWAPSRPRTERTLRTCSASSDGSRTTSSRPRAPTAQRRPGTTGS